MFLIIVLIVVNAEMIFTYNLGKSAANSGVFTCLVAYTYQVSNPIGSGRINCTGAIKVDIKYPLTKQIRSELETKLKEYLKLELKEKDKFFILSITKLYKVEKCRPES